MTKSRTLETRGQLFVPNGEEIIEARDELLATKHKVKPGCRFYSDTELKIFYKELNHAAIKNNEDIVLARVAPGKTKVMEVYSAVTFQLIGYAKKSGLEPITYFSNTFKERMDDPDVFSAGNLYEDIRQGSAFGNCFLLASLNSIVDRVGGQPYLRSIVRQEHGSTSVVRLYDPVKKKFVYYRVDNTYYYKNSQNVIVYKHKWAHLIDKAYSILAIAIVHAFNGHHKYELRLQSPEVILNGGEPACALEVLTGQAANTFKIPKPCPPLLCLNDVEKYLKSAVILGDLMEIAGSSLMFRLLSEMSKTADIELDTLCRELSFSELEDMNNIDGKDKEEISEYEFLQERVKKVDVVVSEITRKVIASKLYTLETFAPKFKMFLKAFFDFSDRNDILKRILPKSDLLIIFIRAMDKSGMIDRYNDASQCHAGALECERFLALYNAIQTSLSIYEALINPLKDLSVEVLNERELKYAKEKAEEIVLLQEITYLLNQYMQSRECQEQLLSNQEILSGFGVYSESARELFNNVSKTLGEDYALMVASTRKKHELNMKGVAPEHAYTVLATFEAPHLANSQILKFAVVKNPWGHTGVCYSFGQGELLTAESKRNVPQGCFAIEWNDFICNYDSIATGSFQTPEPLPEHVRAKYDTSFSANMGKSQAMVALGVGTVGGASIIPAGLGLGLLAIPTAPALLMAAGVGAVIGFISYLLGVRRAQKNALNIHVAEKNSDIALDEFILIDHERPAMEEVVEPETYDPGQLQFNLFAPPRVDVNVANEKATRPQLSREMRDVLQSIHLKDIKAFTTSDGKLKIPANKIDYQAFRYFIIRDILCAADLRQAFELAAQIRTNDEIVNGQGNIAENIRLLLDAVLNEYCKRCEKGEYTDEKALPGCN